MKPAAAAASAGLASLDTQAQSLTSGAIPDKDHMAEEIKKEKIRRAMLAGPHSITSEATVADMDEQGNMTVLSLGTNDWVCVPGNQNIIGWTDMCIDPMGMVWVKDWMARKP